MNKFIVFEGLDGSGKTSQIQLLAKHLEDMGEKVYVTAEPTNYETGSYLRRILSNSLEKDINLQAALFLADRIEHITHPEHGIKKYLDEGYTVICDRYYYSSMAYQGKNRDCDFDWVINLNIKCKKIIKPDLCIFLDVNPTTCKERIDSTRENIELYEKSTVEMSNIRCGFLEVFDRLKKAYDQNIVIIDANRSIDDIFEEVLEHV